MKRFFLPILWMVVIFAFSSIPGDKIPRAPFGFDKLVHIFEYFILGYLWNRVLNRGSIVVIIGVIYGFIDEVHQIFIPYREFSIIDLLADGSGLILSVLWHSLLKR